MTMTLSWREAIKHPVRLRKPSLQMGSGRLPYTNPKKATESNFAKIVKITIHAKYTKEHILNGNGSIFLLLEKHRLFGHASLVMWINHKVTMDHWCLGHRFWLIHLGFRHLSWKAHKSISICSVLCNFMVGWKGSSFTRIQCRWAGPHPPNWSWLLHAASITLFMALFCTPQSK